MQAVELLAHGPNTQTSSCLAPILAGLVSPYLPQQRPAIYKAAWHLVAVVTESRADDDALLRHLTSARVLVKALENCSWDAMPDEV